MTFATLQATNVGYFEFFSTVFFMNLYEFVVVSIAFGIYVGFAVAIDTPAHGERWALLYYLHFLYFPMAILALQTAYIGMLGVVEVG